MKIELYAPGVCDLSKVDEDGYIDVPEGTTYGQLLKMIKLPFIWRKVFPCFLNYEKKPLDTVLHNEDVVSIFTPMAGG